MRPNSSSAELLRIERWRINALSNLYDRRDSFAAWAHARNRCANPCFHPLVICRQNIPRTMGSLRVSETATNIFQCHACGGAAPELKARAFTSLVGSDCTPASGDVRIGVCRACGLLQKEISPAWSELCAKIYGSYRIYHQGAGEEQKARGTDGGELKPRSDLIAEFLCNTRKLRQAGSALDIGSGNGPFVRAMQKSLPRWSLTGSDVTDRFRKQIEAIGPNIFISADR